MSFIKKDSLKNALTFGRRTKAGSAVEIDIGGPPTAERVSLSTGRSDVLTMVPPVLRTGLVEVCRFFFSLLCFSVLFLNAVADQRLASQ